MADEKLITGDQQAKAAQATKFLAEANLMEQQAAKAAAEARKATAEAEAAESALEQVRISTDRELFKRQRELADDQHVGVFRFAQSVDSNGTAAIINHMVSWRRMNPDADEIRFIINSPGGEVVAGVSLFDFLRSLSSSGVHVTTVATGMAASMGAILTQAGDTRIIMPTASFMLHEAAFGAVGKTSEIEDRTEWVKMIQERFKFILAERSTLSAKQIGNRWTRKDWWMMPEEAVKLGFFDQIGDSENLL